jgi:hypothetical protein
MTNKRKRERVRNAQKRDAKSNAKIAKAYTPRFPMETPIAAQILTAVSILAHHANPYRSIGRGLLPYVNHGRNYINI